MALNTKTILNLGVLISFGFSSLVNATVSSFSQAMDLKTQAIEQLDKKHYLAAAKLYEQAVQKGLSSQYGYWKAIDAYVKAGALEQALVPMKIMADSGSSAVNYYQMLAEPFKNSFNKQYLGILAQVKNNAVQAELKALTAPQKKGQIYTKDVRHFFQAFDQAKHLKSLAEKREVYQQYYFNKASEGMIDYVSMKISGIDRFVEYVEKNRAFYEDVKQESSQLESLIPVANKAMANMKQYYPEAPNSDIYFIVGMHTSAGTASDNDILLGADFIAASKDNLSGLKEWTHPYITGAEDKVWVVVHEYVHVLQNTGHETVLGNALVEGGADFLANLLYAPLKEPSLYTTFGLANESMIKQKFMEQLDSTDISLWTGNNSKELPENWVPDLGYFVGHQIAKGYYDQASDKAVAIRALLKLEKPHEILKKSGYLSALEDKGTGKGF